MQPRSPLAVSAEVAALERRIERLEEVFLGRSPPRFAAHLLLDLHRWLDATSRCAVITEDDSQLVVNAAMGLDEASMLEMGRLAGDPFAWAVIVRLLRAAQATYALPALRDAEAHVVSIARNLLRIQGLGIVDIEDIVSSGTPMQRAVRDIFVSPIDSSTPLPSNGLDASLSPRTRRRAPAKGVRT